MYTQTFCYSVNRVLSDEKIYHCNKKSDCLGNTMHNGMSQTITGKHITHSYTYITSLLHDKVISVVNTEIIYNK